MTERSIVVKMRADISSLRSGMKESVDRINSVADAAEKTSTRAGAGLARMWDGAGKGLAWVDKNSQSINTLGNGFLTFGVAAAAGVGVAVSKFADFDQAMSHVAASGEDARANLDALRQAAIDAGATTAFSATEAAQGIENLAKAGVSAQDTLGGGLKGALDLAAAGSVDVGFAAETAATAMTQFKLSGADVPHIADLLAAAAGKAQGEVSDFAGALNQSGLVASQFGLSIEESTGTLAAFASAGLLGSDAGTSFKTMLLRLANPSAEAAATMKDLGINAYDAQGQFVGIASLAGQLQKGMSGLSQAQRDAALSTIFGSDAIRAANVLYQQGAEGIRDWTSQVDDAGFAALTASTKMDNLKGDIEGLGGAIESTLIKSGSGANTALRSLTKEATEAVRWVGDLPAPVLETGVKLTAFGGIGLIAAGGLMRTATGAAEAYTAFKSLQQSSPRAASAIGKVGKAAGVASAGLIALQVAGAVSSSFDADFTPSLEAASKAILDLSKTPDANLDEMFRFESGVVIKERVDSLGSALQRLGQNRWSDQFAEGVDSVAGTTDSLTRQIKLQFGALDQSLMSFSSSGHAEQAATSFARIADEAARQNVPVEQLISLFPQYAQSIRATADANQFTITSAQQLVDIMSGKLPEGFVKSNDSASQSASAYDKAASSMGLTGAAAQQAAADIEAATEKLYANANAALALSGNAIAVEAAMDAASKAAKDNGKNLDISTEKGRANQQALDSLASAALNATQAMVEQDKPAAQIAATNERARASYIKTAQAMGMEEKQARKTADALFVIPEHVASQVVVSGTKVSAKEAAGLNKALESIPAEKRAEIKTIAETKGAKAAHAAIQEVKGKQVLAKVIGDIKGAKSVDAAQKALKDRLVKAESKGDKRGAEIVRAAMNALENKKVNAKAVPSGEKGVRSLKSAVDSLSNKSVTATVTTRRVTVYETRGGKVEKSGKRIKDPGGATGGLMTAAGFVLRGPLHRSNGGPVWGAGTATSDSIPALLSDGEFVHRAAAVDYYGAGLMAALNSMQIPRDAIPGYASGGQVGGTLASIPAGVDMAAIWRLVTAVTRPYADIQTAMRAVTKAQTVKAKEDRDVAAARRRVSSASGKKAKSKARSNLNKQLREQKDATAKLTEKTKDLTSAQQVLADAARSQSNTFAEPYRSSSTDIGDWLESMHEGASDLTAFQQDLAQLRKMGLSETLVQQIAEKGAIVGHELADQILDGGNAMRDALNEANGNLQKAADRIGYDLVSVAGRYAGGGMLYGPGTGTSDSMLIAASTGEFITNAAATAKNLPLLRAMNDGYRIQPTRIATGSTTVTHTKQIHMGEQHVTVVGADPDVLVRKMANARRDAYSLAMAAPL